MNSSSIIDKIRQLRALSQSSNVNEAAAAAAAADRLISKHRISEAEIAIANRAADLPAEEDQFVLYETARVIRWKQSLAMLLSKHYGCAVWNDCVFGASDGGRKISRLRMVGLKSDMEIVRYMFAWLTTEIERLSKSHCAGRGHIYSQSYCEGAVSGIKAQLDLVKQEERLAASKSEQTTTALACLDGRLNKAELALHSLHTNLKTVRTYSHRHLDGSAYRVGEQVGKSIHLGKVMGTTGASKMLK